MRKKILFLLFVLTEVLFHPDLFGQTIDTVTTFTFSSTSRSGVFQFPDNPAKSYHKIKMLYRMRCKNGLVSTSANRNLGCGEWDYSCNTYLTDSSRYDSVKATFPDHTISGYSGSSFPYSLSPTYAITRYRHYSTSQVSIADSGFSLKSGITAVQAPFSGQAGNRKMHYLWKASELQASGLSAGPITALSLEVLQAGAEIRHFRIRMKAVSDSSITSFSDASGMSEVFFRHLTLSDTGLHKLPFHQFFNWDGTSNILIEISCSNGIEAPGLILRGGASSFNSTTGTEENDFYLETDGSSGGISCGDIQSLDSAQKFTFEGWVNIRNWQNWTGIFKDNGKTVLELGDVPGNLYCIIRNPSNTYGYATNVLPLNTWTHVAMVFDGTAATNAERLKLYINGVQKTLTYSGTIPAYTENNNTPLIVGKGVAGRFDDIRVWDKALGAGTIAGWYKREVTDAHPDFSGLRAAYKLNEGSGNTLQDLSSFQNNGSIEGNTSWRIFPGFSMFKNSAPTFTRPNIRLHKGAINQLIAESFALDSLQDLPRIVTQYALVNGQPAAVDTFTRFLAAGNRLLEENGTLLQVYPSDTSGILNIGTLNYFSKFPQKVELMSFVTPYGINLNMGPKGKVWEFDVTDFVQQLKGRKRISIERGGEYQEDLDIRFVFYEGIPARKVLSLTQIWPVTHSPNSQIIVDKVYEPRSIKMDPLSAGWKIRSAVTGHGQEGEFIPRQHWINVLYGGFTAQYAWSVWKGCAHNPVYPQGGTWIYDRAGWCPGAPTDVQEFDLANVPTPGENVLFDYGMEAATGDSRYIASHQLVQYAAASRVNDASIEEVRNPGDRVEFSRRNPSCMNPNILIKNHGSAALTSLNIHFGLQGGSEQVYNWTGNLPFMQSTEVQLPLPNLGTMPGTFQVRISSPNGASDEFSRNDTIRSSYGAPLLVTGPLVVDLKTNVSPGENSWELRNSNGEVIGSGGNFLSNTSYRDTFNLAPGCYEFQLLDEGQDGLSWWANTAQGNGVLRFRSLSNTILKTFNPDFGAEIFQQFVVQQPSNSKALNAEFPVDLLLYPNPVHDVLNYEAEINQKAQYSDPFVVEISDLAGKVLQRKTLKVLESGTINIGELPVGLYQFSLKNKEINLVRRFSRY